MRHRRERGKQGLRPSLVRRLQPPRRMSTSTRSLLSAAALGAGVLGIYAFLVEPRWVELTPPRIHVRGLHPGLEGLRVALLTDLHAGAGTPLSLVRRACRMAMRERRRRAQRTAVQTMASWRGSK